MGSLANHFSAPEHTEFLWGANNWEFCRNLMNVINVKKGSENHEGQQKERTQKHLILCKVQSL